jgi:hypothetical protein
MSDNTAKSFLSDHTDATTLSNSIPGLTPFKPPPHRVFETSSSASENRHPEDTEAPVQEGGSVLDRASSGQASESDQRPATASSHGSVFGSGRSPPLLSLFHNRQSNFTDQQAILRLLADIGEKVNETNLLNARMATAMTTMSENFTTMANNVNLMQANFGVLAETLVRQNSTIIDLLRSRGPPADN